MNNSHEFPRCGEVWIANFSPTIGREQSGVRMCVIVSVDRFNKSPAELVFACPTTTTKREIPTHVEILPPEGGLPKISYVKCEDLKSISKIRLQKRLGVVSDTTLNKIRERIKFLMGL